MRLLTFLRAEERTVRYEGGTTRGKLAVPLLRKLVAQGTTRIFKQRRAVAETVAELAFTLLVDVPGSMAGTRAIHAARTAVMFSEVFEKLGIPYEAYKFGSDTRRIKGFTEPLAPVRDKLGGLVKANGGSTNLYTYTDEVKNHAPLLARPERRKYLLIISDGGVNRSGYPATFRAWRKEHHATAIGIGVNCGDEIVKVCGGRGIAVTYPAQLPKEFASLIKKLIKEKGRNA